MRNLFASAALFVTLACSTGAQQNAEPALGASDVAARVGDRAITAGELDARWREDRPSEHAQATQAVYDGRRAALDALVADLLVAQAAKAKGQTAEQYKTAEVTSRVKPVTDAEIEAFYNENRSQMQGRGLQEMVELVRDFLQQRRQAAAIEELVADLRKTAPPVQVLFDPPRRELAIAADDPSLGKADAPVTLVEFSDFQCPFCQRVSPTLKRVREQYGDRVRIVWKDFPLTQIHPQAFGAAMAGQCARDQGKFWEFHDRLFTNQQALGPDALKRYANDVGLDVTKFVACVDSSKHEARIRAAMSAGAQLGVSSTPTTFVNGRLVSGAQPFNVFSAIIDEELERARK